MIAICNGIYLVSSNGTLGKWIQITVDNNNWLSLFKQFFLHLALILWWLSGISKLESINICFLHVCKINWQKCIKNFYFPKIHVTKFLVLQGWRRIVKRVCILFVFNKRRYFRSLRWWSLKYGDRRTKMKLFVRFERQIHRALDLLLVRVDPL